MSTEPQELTTQKRLQKKEVQMSTLGAPDTVTAQRRAALGVMESPTLDSWQEGPHNRWVFRNVEETIPSARISHRPASAVMPSLGLGAIEGVSDLASRLESTYTDGLVVERGGQVVAEYYAPGFGPGQTHLLMSVSKSLCAIVVGSLCDDGLIDPLRNLEHYLPGLAGSAFADATIEQLLDMTAAVDYSEDYDDPASEVQLQDRAGGWRTNRPGDPADTYEFLARLKRSKPHGEVFQYCSATTDTLGLLVEAVTGQRYSEVLAERLWSKLGADQEARISIDRGGIAIANAGISCTTRDLARVGRLMLSGGVAAGGRVVSEQWVTQTLAGGDSSKWQSARRDLYPEGSYRNQWWATGNARGNVYAVGIYGQYIWLDPASDTVIAKFSTEPAAVGTASAAAHSELFADICEVFAGE